MSITEFLMVNPLSFAVIAGIFGLLVGSFLNVVIFRLPVVLEKSWRTQCEDLLKVENKTEQKRFDLVFPRSQCPQCHHTIGAAENIPILSYLIQKGKCKHCQKSISIRYPIIEAVTAVFSLWIAWHYGFSTQAMSALLLTWALIALTMIDIDHQLLPDNITLPLLWIGLILSLFNVFTDPQSSIIGAVSGYLCLWIVFHAFKLLTGKEGMGYGDFKLLAVFGAWLGWQYIPLVILMSSFVGAVVGILMIIVLGRDRRLPIPFGPYLAAAGWICLFWGEKLLNMYLSFSGISI